MKTKYDIETDTRRKNLPKALKRYREMNGITQKEMGEHLGIPYQDYQKYEYGHFFPKRNRFIAINNKIKMTNASAFYNVPRAEN